MSHFAVLVIGEDVKAALRPFQENNMNSCPPEFLKFFDEEDEYRRKYESESSEMIELEDGSHVYPWDERFRVRGSIGTGSDTHRPPENLKRVDVPHRERFETFETFMADYCGYKRRDRKTQRYGHWENPNRKWDWWEIGGRYSGRLVTKDGRTVNQARIGDLDRDAMRRKGEERGREAWAAYEADIAKGLKPEAARWVNGLDEGDTIESVTAWCARLSAFAVLKNGEWFERGSMGWWGLVSDEKDRGEWEKQIDKLLSDLAPETLITFVDCHI